MIKLSVATNYDKSRYRHRIHKVYMYYYGAYNSGNGNGRGMGCGFGRSSIVEHAKLRIPKLYKIIPLEVITENLIKEIHE